MTGAVILLFLVTASRLAELVLARRNTLALLRRGAYEVAGAHYRLIVTLHAAWFGTLWIMGPAQPVNLGWLGVFALLQIGRVWVLTTLGSRWTTRILIVPGETLVDRGPYRYFSHPNYLVVIGEIAVLPMCLGLPSVALVFTVLNAALLVIRIRAENAGLNGRRPDAPAL